MNFDYNVTPLYRKKMFEKKHILKFKPIITIVTPFYNSGKYILETADCVLNQTFPWFEWIIVDDGSKNQDSLKTLEKLSKADDRIKVFHKENEGLAATRDYGANKACDSSEYLLFLDDDDLIELNYVECLYCSLLTNPKANFAYTNCVGFGEQNYLWDVRFDIEREKVDNILVATALIRKKDFFEVGGYGLKEKGINEDWIFWMKFFSKGKVPIRLNYFGFWYRRKKTGELSAANNNKKRTQELIKPYLSQIGSESEYLEYPMDNYEWNDVNIQKNIFEIPSKIESKKESIVMIMPHIVMGGADKFNIDFLKGLNKKYSVTVILTNISNNEWLSEVKKYCDSYYILPSFLERKYWHLFIEYLIKKNDTKLVFNTNSVYGYICLPYIKNKYPNIKILDYIHMEEWYNRNGGYSRDSSAVGSVIDKTLLCNNNSEKILVNYFGRNKKELETVYIGVDEKLFVNNYNKKEINEIKEKYNIPLDKKVITFIARISDQKRPFLLEKIIKKYFSKNDDSVFVVCGDGPLLEPLKQVLKDEIRNNKVLFLGAIKNTKEIYAVSDCTLNCSIKEGLALTTYESLSMGIPVVSTKVGGQAEIIDKTVGFVIDTKQEEKDVLNYKYDLEEINEFVASLEKVLKRNKYYKSNCREKVLSGFTIEQMNKRMNKIIETLIKKDSDKRFDNTDIALELINQHLLEDKNAYNYINETFKLKYQWKKQGKLNILKNKIRLSITTISEFYDKMTIKLHVYNEAILIKKATKYLLKSIISVLLIPISIVEKIISMFNKILRRK